MKLTEAQRRVLKNLAAGRRSDYGFKLGRSTAGGLSGTFLALRRHGFIALDANEYRITPAGTAALEESRDA